MQSARILFITRWEVVNGMWAARQRGHGWVSAYLKRVGVPCSTGYRWDKKLRWLVEHGPASLLIPGLHLAAEPSAEAWGEVFDVLGSSRACWPTAGGSSPRRRPRLGWRCRAG